MNTIDKDLNFILQKAHWEHNEEAFRLLLEVIQKQREQIYDLQDRVSELEMKVRKL